MAHRPLKLSPKVQPLFDAFTNLANKSALHPYDWNRFYAFLCAAHRFRSRLSGSDVKELLLAQGFQEDYASDIAEVYEHGRAIISKSKGAVFAYPGQDPDELNRELRRHKQEVLKLLEDL